MRATLPAHTPAPRTRPTTALDVRRLLKHLGGVAAIHRKLTLLGFEDVPTEHQMRKWVHRRRIDSNWLLVLLVQAKAEGRPVDLTEFVA